MNRPTVLLLFGGESSEHDVSISSARNVYAAIDDNKYDVELGYIDREGKWWLLDDLETTISTHAAPQLVPVLGSQSFVTFPAGKVVKPDVILPILHGSNGEDGTVQGLAQLLHIPIAGNDMTTSALCMDKVLTKRLLEREGIATVPYEVHKNGAPMPDFNRLSMRLGSPMFVKPSRSGSSVGVSKVYSEEELGRALEEAHRYGETALIERGIAGHELEVAILGDAPHHKVSGVCEVKPPADDFYSYDAKYSAASATKFIIPADIGSGVTEKIRALATKAYEVAGCKGLARIDFFLVDDGTVYVNEINTLPGFTNMSVYPKLWRQEGVSYSQLIERLILLALGDTIKADETEE